MMLIDIHSQDWMTNEAFRKELHDLSDNDIRMYPDLSEADQITMLACDALRPGLLQQLPNLQLVQKLGAGVDTMVSDPDLLPQIRVTRLKHRTTALEMARFCLAHVLQDVQNLDYHRQCQSQSKWQPKAPKRVADLKVGVLGLSLIHI